ncbi:hypothetical protein [Acrocarpospora corrugata]|uniref:nSTAND1 domain-containing NTPase n=1 Tax=Acrocarpospora corrugata TaxID=35763 RepID=UPI0012D31A66|nr:hypothetical protein [Acrocarpospora corrugata]
MTGASGAGKSSLLRAGLWPALAQGKLSEQARQWPRGVLDRPTSAPLERLATLLAGLAGLEVTSVLRQLADHPEQCHLLVRQAVEADAVRRGLSGREAAASRLLLVIDQFEEVFTGVDSSAAVSSEGQAAALIAALHAAATRPCGPEQIPAALVVLAVRGDYIDRCAGFRLLAPALAQPFIVGPMNEPELRLAITGPAAEAGLELEAGLADDILAELRQGPGEPLAGTLPLLSQAMLTIWEHREGIRLTRRGYGRTGGVRQAVAASADAAYRELDEDAKAAARRLFHQLTTVTSDGIPARRAVPRAVLGIGGDDGSLAPEDPGPGLVGHVSGVARVLEVFTKRRLLVVDRETVQIARDACWWAGLSCEPGWRVIWRVTPDTASCSRMLTTGGAMAGRRAICTGASGWPAFGNWCPAGRPTRTVTLIWRAFPPSSWAPRSPRRLGPRACAGD